MEAPIVSVIMTVYNDEQYLAEAIESIRRQTLTNFELVIVDDGSSDHTPEILAQKSINDPRIKLITSPHIGRAKALNLAWKNSVGRYIANLDADDLSEPTRLEKQEAFLQQHPNVGALGTARRFLNQFYDGLENKEDCNPPFEDKELRHIMVRYNPFSHSSVMMRRDVLEKTGGYNELLRVSIDYELWVRIARNYEIAKLPEVLEVHRIHQTSHFSSIHPWEKYWVLVRIRWLAWLWFSRRISELCYILDPLHLPQDFVRNTFPQLTNIYHKLARHFR